MAYVNPGAPNLADFTTFVYAQGVPSADLPSSSDYLIAALQYAQNRTINAPGIIPGTTYTDALYNLGMHQILKISLDTGSFTWFTDARKQYNLRSFTGGIVQSSADANSSSTVAVPELLKNVSMSNLDCLKTPWGREYLAYAQDYGPYIVGVT